jgi:Fe2+ transport system protein FeoA
MRLTDLPPGRCGWVVDVEAAGDGTERLKVMGVCAGRKVRLVRRGDPMILCVWGTRVGVSRRLAQQVHVQPCDNQVHVGTCRPSADREG